MMKILEKEFVVSEKMLKYITDEEIREIRNICRNISKRAERDIANKSIAGIS